MADVSGVRASVKLAVSPVPLMVYPVTIYPATEIVVPEELPEIGSENPSRIPSIFPFPLLSTVVRVRSFGAIASVTPVLEKLAR